MSVTAVYSQTAEEALLSALLIDPDAMVTLPATITPDAFFLEKHGKIFNAIVTLYSRGDPVDAIMVSEMVSFDATYLLSVVATSLNSESYAKVVIDCAIRRRLIATAERLATGAYNRKGDIKRTVNDTYKELLDAAAPVERRARSAKAIATEILDDLDRERPPTAIVRTGFVDLDRQLGGGMLAGELLIVAGRPGMGKTMLAIQIARNVAERGGRVLHFSPENKDKTVIGRLVFHDTGISTKQASTTVMDDEKRVAYQQATAAIGELPYWIYDMAGLRVANVITQTNRQFMGSGLDLMIVDYLQLLATPGVKDPVGEIGDISRRLKELARDLNIPVLAVAKLNRDVEKRKDKRPLMSDLRGCGQIEQDADVIMFIYRDEYYSRELSERPNVAEIDVAKNREGDAGEVEMYFNNDRAKFADLEWRAI